MGQKKRRKEVWAEEDEEFAEDPEVKTQEVAPIGEGVAERKPKGNRAKKPKKKAPETASPPRCFDRFWNEAISAWNIYGLSFGLMAVGTGQEDSEESGVLRDACEALWMMIECFSVLCSQSTFINAVASKPPIPSATRAP